MTTVSMKDKKLGPMRAILSRHVFAKEVEKEIDRIPTQTVIGLGQGGGRIAAQLAVFGHPTFLVNSSKTDMGELEHIIPNDRMYLTKSERYPTMEGTDKNAKLGFEIAKDNKEIYKKIATSQEVQTADFVWVSVSLGGGTGNGALKVALAYLAQVRAIKALPDGKIPLGVICSLPSTSEKGSSFRKNALAGINVLQKMIDENKIGSVLVIDNEKIENYYAGNPLVTSNGTQVDARSYSNMVVASSIAEITTLPVMRGRSVLDKAELLSTLSTPGWLSISRMDEINDDDKLDKEGLIRHLFEENEILAKYELADSQAGAIAVIYPDSKRVSPELIDEFYKYTSDLLNIKVNSSVSNNSAIDSLTVYGINVLSVPSIRVSQLREELDQWIEIEKQLEEKKKQASAALDEFDDFFSSDPSPSNQQAKELTIDDLDDDDFLSSTTKPKEKSKMIDLNDLDDLDF